MATLRTQDRLQPALLDRLTDDDPSSQVEAAEARAISRTRLREMILRDLTWLFNATHQGDAIDRARAPHAARSVLSFGLPAFSGQSLSGVDLADLQRQVHQAIVLHEPRILAETLMVEALSNDLQADHHNQIGFRISGQMWAQPVPLELLLHTNIDLETGRVEIREGNR